MKLHFCVVSRGAGALRAGSAIALRRLGQMRDIALPSQCALCGNLSQKVLCAGCDEQYWNQTRTRCQVCALPLPVLVMASAVSAGVKNENGAHLPCRCIVEPSYFDATIALADYYAPLDTLALDLKFHARLATADEFARQLQAAFETTDAAAPDVIAPVPLSHRRLRSRGYNRRGRSANRLRAGLARSGFCAMYAAIVDDVMTSGATLDVLVFMLKSAGARRVTNFVALRTLQD